MTRIFVRVYLSLGAIFLLCLALILVAGRAPKDTTLPGRFQAAANAPAAVAHHLGGATTPEERERAEQALAQALGAPVHTIPLAQAVDTLDALAADRLQRGEPVAHALHPGAPPEVLVRVPDQPWVAVVHPGGPPPWLAGPGPLLLLTGLVALLGVAAVVAWTLRPLQRQLVDLSAAATRFGAGELTVRSPVHDEGDAGRLALSFNEMADHVQGLIQARQELLMAVSHELRTPVARLRFAVEMLADIDDADERERRVERVQRDLVELDDLIGELLTYTSLDDGRRPLLREEVQPDKELVLLVDDARQLKADVHVSLTMDGMEPVLVDGRLFKRAVSNLLANAVRYGGGEVQVSARVTHESLTVIVDDNGPGIPVDQREAIFEPLVRLEKARSRNTGGVGLGLALAQRIAKAHRGTLTVETSPLGGARFALTLPRAGTGAYPVPPEIASR